MNGSGGASGAVLERCGIQVLPPEEAKKIAAGEVVDRPAALVRELIDNALDAGSSVVELAIEDGGIRKVEVIDNGWGMSREDLELCIKTHATSKIRSLDDLTRTSTLGFRGEALAAAAAVARLEILTALDDGNAWLLRTLPAVSGESAARETIVPAGRTRGTSVRALGLFDSIPARKRFLKREGSEGAMCRQIFIEKALAFPAVSFRFMQDGRLKLFAAAVQDTETAYKARFGELVLSAGERPFLHEVYAGGSGFSVTAVFGGPEVFRYDRRQQYVFANNRRIHDFGLAQALEYGLAGLFPNSAHPVGALFISIDPAIADFNIHPAKREARFADSGAIHHAVSSALLSYVRAMFAVPGQAGNAAGSVGAAGTAAPSFPFSFRESGGAERSAGFFQARPGGNNANNLYGGELLAARLSMEALLEKRDEFQEIGEGASGSPGAVAEQGVVYDAPAGAAAAGGLSLVGRVFGLFLIVQRGDTLYIIDQHAAHERILYNRFLSAPPARQELLVPILFTTESERDDEFLRAKKDELLRLGIELEDEGGGNWRIEALPAVWRSGDGETVRAILDLKNAGSAMAPRWASALACKAAVKDGAFLDDRSTLELAAAALGSEGRCPHGRPIWTELSRADLFKAVRRTK